MPASPSSLERAILATIAYFDLFSYPLTVVEVWKWLYRDHGAAPETLPNVDQVLRTSPFLAQRLEERDGMFLIRGRGEIVEVRRERYLLAERKFRRLQRVMRILGAMPFVRAVAVCNTLAYANARDESDLDLLVITAPGHIWTARMFATGIATVLGWRPTRTRMRDTICLSFYLSSDAFDLRRLALSDDDLYFRYWLDQLVPVAGDSELIGVLRESNGWYRERLPNAFGTSPSLRRMHRSSRLAVLLRRIVERAHSGYLGIALERTYRNWQVTRLPAKLKMLANLDSRVVVSNRMLKFHDNDRREEFLERFGAHLNGVARS